MRMQIHEFLLGIGFGVFLAIQGVYFLDRGLEVWQVGVVLGIAPVFAAIFEVPLGALADVRGRIFTFRMSLLARIIAGVLLISGGGILLLAVSMAFLGVAMALMSGTIDAWFVEVLKSRGEEDEVEAHTGIFQATMALGMVAGSVGGGYLPSYAPKINMISGTEWNVLFVTILVIAHLLVTPLLFREGETTVSKGGSGRTYKSRFSLAYQTIRKSFWLKNLLVLGVLVGIGMATIDAFWQPRAREISPDISYTVFGWVTAGYFASSIIGPLIITNISRALNISIQAQILIVPVLFSSVMVFLSFAENTPHFIALYLFFILVYSMANPPMFTLLNKLVDDEVRSTMLSLSSLAFTFGGAISAFVVSQLVRAIGLQNAWLVIGATLTVFFTVIAILTKIKSKTKGGEYL